MSRESLSEKMVLPSGLGGQSCPIDIADCSAGQNQLYTAMAAASCAEPSCSVGSLFGYVV